MAIRVAGRRTIGFDLVVRLVWALALAVLLGYPIVELFARSVRSRDGGWTLGFYGELFADPLLLTATLNSLWVGAGTVVGSLVIALPLAFLVSRTDLPGKRFLGTTAVLTFAAPSFIAALGWILLLGSNGLINTALMGWFGLAEPPIDIFGPWGIIFVLSTFLYPLVFLPVSAALNNVDPALEQAAAGFGAGRARVLRIVTFPLVLPAIAGGAILTFVTSFVIFGPVAVLGAPAGFQTIPTVLLRLISAPPRIETAAVMSVPVLVVIGVALLLRRQLLGARRFTVLGGKPAARPVQRLGRARPVAAVFAYGVFVLTLVLPFGVLALTSFRKAIGRPLGPDNLVLFDNYRRVFQNPQIGKAFTTSILASVGGVVIGLALALLAAWLVHRTRSRANTLVAPAMLAPLAFPGAVLGIGMIIAFARPPWGLGGSLAILVLAYGVHTLPLAFTYVNAAMSQVGPELEEAARSLGAGWPRTWRQITLPLLRPSVVAAALISFVMLFRELEMSVFLYTGANPTTATVLYELAGESQFQLIGALSVVILAVNIAVVLLAVRLLPNRQEIM